MTFYKHFFPKLLILLLMGLSAVWVYHPVADAQYLTWDDDVHIVENISLQGLDKEHIHEIFTSTVNDIYIPLTSLSFAIEQHYFGLNSSVTHIVNLILHILNSLMVLLIMMSLGLRRVSAAIVSILFIIHPIHVESVAWATERKDVLFALFYLTALWQYIRYVQENSHKTDGWVRMGLVYALCLLSMLAKPMALSLPIVLCLIDWFLKRRWHWRIVIEKVPVLMICAGIGWITYRLHARIPGEGWLEGSLIWVWSAVFYIKQFLFPIILVPIYQLPEPVSLTQPQYFLSLSCFFLILYSCFIFRRYRPYLFSMAFYLGTIFFILRFDNVEDMNLVADRFMYLPALGFYFLIGYFIQNAFVSDRFRRKNVRFFSLIVLSFMFVFFASQSSRLVRVWQSSQSLWRHQLRFYPKNHIALNNLAADMESQINVKEVMGKHQASQNTMSNNWKNVVEEADLIEGYRKIEYIKMLYRQAVYYQPNFADGYFNLAKLYASLAEDSSAITFYQKALELEPSMYDAYLGLAEVYLVQGKYQRALDNFSLAKEVSLDKDEFLIILFQKVNQAVKDHPQVDEFNGLSTKIKYELAQSFEDNPKMSSRNYYNLAVMYSEMDQIEQAIGAYKKSLKINPKNPKSLYNLGNIYKQLQHNSLAIDYYLRAIEASPLQIQSYLNLGAVYGREQEWEKAKDIYIKMLAVKSDDAVGYFNLAFTYEQLFDDVKAVEAYQKSIQLDPYQTETFYNLGNLYARLGHRNFAIQAFQSAVNLDSRHSKAWFNLGLMALQSHDVGKASKAFKQAEKNGYVIPRDIQNRLTDSF